jgi:hypothetical protein
MKLRQMTLKINGLVKKAPATVLWELCTLSILGHRKEKTYEIDADHVSSLACTLDKHLVCQKIDLMRGSSEFSVLILCT